MSRKPRDKTIVKYPGGEIRVITDFKGICKLKEGHTIIEFYKPAEARALANWLNKWADWRVKCDEN
jgi:hypothetical protein